jgi:succinate dehydrogenase / fumarate reductase, cytochrome b subunit
MDLERNISLAAALRYKGQAPMWSFILHRIGGVGMAIFITLHILASFIGGRTGVFINTIYEHWLFQIFIFFCVLFHAINGLRITIVDLFPKLLVHQREAIWVELVVFIPLFAVSVFVIMSTAL